MSKEVVIKGYNINIFMSCTAFDVSFTIPTAILKLNKRNEKKFNKKNKLKKKYCISNKSIKQNKQIINLHGFYFSLQQ